MEQNENKNVETAEATQVSHEETRKKLKKQRVRQIVASLIGVAILAFGPVFPGDEVREHKPDEFIEIERLMDNAKIMADAIYELAR